VKGLWDTALMSYLQRDTALLEGITGEGHTRVVWCRHLVLA
jgi:hypothetical protein